MRFFVGENVAKVICKRYGVGLGLGIGGWGVGRGNWEKRGRRVSKVAKYDDGILVRSTVMGRR